MTPFSSKMACQPVTCHGISRNHSNQFSPNLPQNMSKGNAHSYLKTVGAEDKRKTLWAGACTSESTFFPLLNLLSILLQ